MNRMLVIGFAVAMLAGCRSQQEGAGTQGAQEREPTAGAQPGAQAQPQMATGTLTAVQDDQITVRTAAGQQMEMKLSDDAQIMMNGQPVQRDRLQQGASVRASYSQEGGEMMVQRLEVQSMGGAAQPGQHPSGMQPGQQPSGAQPGGAQQQPQP